MIDQGRRSALRHLERLEERLVPSGLEFIAIVPIVPVVSLPTAALVLGVDAPSESGGLSLAASLNLNVVNPDHAGPGGDVGGVLDTLAGIVPGVALEIGSGGGASLSIDEGGPLETGLSVTSSGVSVTLPVLTLDLVVEAPTPPDSGPGTPDIPGIPGIPGAPGVPGTGPVLPGVPGVGPVLPGGTDGGAILPGGTDSPASPAIPGALPGSTPTAESPTPTTPIIATNPGSAIVPPPTTAPPVGSTLPGVTFGVPTPGAGGILLAPVASLASVPVDEEQPDREDADSTADASLSVAIPGQTLVNVVAQADAVRARPVVATVSPDDVAAVIEQAAKSEPGPEAPATAAELFARDLEGLERALGALTARFRHLGGELAEQVTRLGILELLMAAGLGCLAFEVLRRWELQRQLADPNARRAFSSLPGPFYRPAGPLARARRRSFTRGISMD